MLSQGQRKYTHHMKELNNRAGQCMTEEKYVVKVHRIRHTCRAGIGSSVSWVVASELNPGSEDMST